MNWTIKLTQKIEKLPKEFKNIRTLKALENLIENLDKIPIEKIEQLIPNVLDWEDLYNK